MHSDWILKLVSQIGSYSLDLYSNQHIKYSLLITLYQISNILFKENDESNRIYWFTDNVDPKLKKSNTLGCAHQTLVQDPKGTKPLNDNVEPISIYWITDKLFDNSMVPNNDKQDPILTKERIDNANPARQ